MSDKQSTKKLPRISSDFALLDVKQGRNALNKRLGPSGEGGPIAVTITGYISQAWGDDDGTSREFGVMVTGVKYG